MKIILGNFDKLHFTESMLGAPSIQGHILYVPISNLFFLKGHEFSENVAIPLAGLLVFRGVISSRRKLTEYIGDPKKPDGFKEEYEVVDVTLNGDANQKHQKFLFEGLMEIPVAWVDWDVIAESFEFHLDAGIAPVHYSAFS
ncbi:hypothetical protein ACO0K9_18940 [Undibacterium sp. Ji50W]|uniref:hypothetical protein n=1 Tax=Undibacterium sp. Ji50W TaxID=3413041 RepID=UPI003BF397F3